jgi:hypothetical protein
VFPLFALEDDTGVGVRCDESAVHNRDRFGCSSAGDRLGR